MAVIVTVCPGSGFPGAKEISSIVRSIVEFPSPSTSPSAADATPGIAPEIVIITNNTEITELKQSDFIFIGLRPNVRNRNVWYISDSLINNHMIYRNKVSYIQF